MKKTNLFLFCNNYPLSSGEFFIDDEMRVIASNFEKTFVFVPKQNGKELNRFIPENIKIIELDINNISIYHKIQNTPFLFSKIFFSELKAIRKLNINFTFTIFKIIFMDLVQAKNLLKTINRFIKNENIKINDVIFYSYWHDYKSFAISLLKCKCKYITAISRSHGWDNFNNRHTPAYLPFKSFILHNLSQTFSISEAGKQEFLKYGDFSSKITVSRLGKDNDRKPIIKKINKDFNIVSCSNIISLKRVNLIIDLIKQTSLPNITWTHFGDGHLRNDIEQYAQEKLINCNFQFKGIVENKEILDFYADNYIDLFINVSEHEGIPVSIMEALSAGIPVVATNVGGTNEIVNKQNGFLIEKKFDVTEVAIVVKNYLLTSEKIHEVYRLNAHKFWKENYNATKNYTDFFSTINK